ncbi:hypothetical protein GCM10015535_02780 [Streptomyces gelaticus]|uniref:Twin-arginine translocation signal domain-containing protein n=1 Tax=Streptomyces gelaticus TaxID=285446 RepID=A0ABQ2VST9_9ACTN|nr:hypothetical protein [Streptomyces gelaticus]GGV74263.1 hypothetical protein GCM10015535_02780 [Streptomyces gelaticus]
MILSRRTFLSASSATAVTAATALLTPAGAAHASPAAVTSAPATATAGFDTLLQRAESLLTGGGFDTADTEATTWGRSTTASDRPSIRTGSRLVPGRRPVLTVAVGGSRGHTHRAELNR